MTKYRTADEVRKSKKSYTLSSESVQFLEAVRKRRRTHSTSAVLEEILQTVRRSVQKRAVERAVADFYDSLSDEETKEQGIWSEFALGELPSSADWK
jgi:hypothetical protein